MKTRTCPNIAHALSTTAVLVLACCGIGSPALAADPATVALTEASTVDARSLERNHTSNGASCSAFIPSDSKTVGSIQLCRSGHSGKDALYACQNFASASGKYRVFFKGGRQPKAIARVAEDGAINEMMWSDAEQARTPVCDFPPPALVPSTTTFIGAGVCQDEADQFIPCAVFRHNTPRSSTITDHMVFYSPDGSGPAYTSTIEIGINRDAVPAEIAFQIGLNLMQTHCCQQRGLQYIEYACQLYPDSRLYRETFEHFVLEKNRLMMASRP